MLRGLATISYWADDLAAAREWYTELLGIAPYFERGEPGKPPAYVEFRVGDYEHELGLIDRKYLPVGASAAPGGVVAYWYVDDLPGAFARLLAMGATEHEPPTERGPGFVTASVIDPFGNILGIMANSHYEAIRERDGVAAG